MKTNPKKIYAYAHWEKFKEPKMMGVLSCNIGRGKEIFSFEYDRDWLKENYAQDLDPALQFFNGPQYAPTEQGNFGIFLDSAPDRWGRFLMRRKEAQLARQEARKSIELKESDYLLKVYDGHRLGGLRFKTDLDGPFLDSDIAMASPPWTSIRDLEHASLQLEKEGIEDDPSYGKWLQMLIAPGASLGGARPKASVIDTSKHLWIAKFPSRGDADDKGAWEAVVHKLATKAGIATAESQAKIFSGKHHTFLTKRFDRTNKGQRLHFASAMTLLNRKDGDDAAHGASYLELAELIISKGAQPAKDLEQLWRRIVFFMCVSNIDDHLRNHGFLLSDKGWLLSPCYDVNPSYEGEGLKLNVSEHDNSQDLNLALEVSHYFRLNPDRATQVMKEVTTAVKQWRKVASQYKIAISEQRRMEPAFRLVEK